MMEPIMNESLVKAVVVASSTAAAQGECNSCVGVELLCVRGLSDRAAMDPKLKKRFVPPSNNTINAVAPRHPKVRCSDEYGQRTT